MKSFGLTVGVTAGFVLPLLLSSQSPAATLDFTFSFDNILQVNEGGTLPWQAGGRPGMVTGVIRGLEEGTGAASSVEVLTAPSGLGVGEYARYPYSNIWTVSRGEITSFDFISFGRANAPYPGRNSSLFFDSSEESFGTAFRAGLSTTSNGVVSGRPGVTAQDIGLTFTRIQDPSAPVPIPDTSALLPGLIGVWVVALRKKG